MRKDVRQTIEKFIKEGCCEVAKPNNFRVVIHELITLYGIENLNIVYDDTGLFSTWKIEFNKYYKQAN